MSSNSQLQIWDLWYSKAGATGIPFARGRLEETKILRVHAPLPVLTVEVRNDIGQVVILPGGEVGRLVSWWNADDGSEWRWQVEFYNHR